MTRTVLVTGGNRGIGLAIANAFRKEGDKVAITFRSGEPPKYHLAVRCDVTNQESVDRAFAEVEAAYGPVEVLVANAGIEKNAPLSNMNDDDWGGVLDTNLTGAFRVARRAAKPMQGLGRGRLVFISSVVGLRGSAESVNYAASKSGLIGMARSMSRELGGSGITANVVAPGFTETAMTADMPDEFRKGFTKQIPLRRTGLPEEIASSVVFLASEGAAYITGVVLRVDGGLAMGQ
jgi:3-oxoacyl-[acyl-carrier protein] reductase